MFSDDDKDISIKNDQPVEDDALFMFDELGSTTTKPALSFRASPFGNDALQRDAVVDDNLKLEFTEKSVSNRKYIEMQVSLILYLMKMSVKMIALFREGDTENLCSS